MSRDDLKKAFEEAEDVLPPAKPNGAGETGRTAFTVEEDATIEKLQALSPLDRDRKIKKSAEELGCTVTTLRRT
jgi:hypothetical protein